MCGKGVCVSSATRHSAVEPARGQGRWVGSSRSGQEEGLERSRGCALLGSLGADDFQARKNLARKKFHDIFPRMAGALRALDALQTVAECISWRQSAGIDQGAS